MPWKTCPIKTGLSRPLASRLYEHEHLLVSLFDVGRLPSQSFVSAVRLNLHLQDCKILIHRNNAHLRLAVASLLRPPTEPRKPIVVFLQQQQQHCPTVGLRGACPSST
jgi:hypothetical protein